MTLRVRESFWFLPAVFGVAAIVAAEVLVAVDHAVVDGGVRIAVLDALSASGGRSILTTIGTAMLTVAGTSFSITISVLATTSSTYGPRLVRNFMADRANQFVLAAFTSTFLYTIVVVRSVHTAVDDGSAFVPVVAVHVAVLLGIVDVAVLVFFIHHIATSVQITSLQKQVQVDLVAALDHAFVDRDESHATVTVAPQHRRPDGGRMIRAASDGSVQSVDWQRLVAWATRHDRVVDMLVMPGDHVIVGDPVVVVTRPSDGTTAPGADLETPDDGAARALRGCITIGTARTPVQDVGFALQQLVEIAVRGLASGTNDPYTAVTALEMAAGALVPAWRDRDAVTGHLDDAGVVRVLPHWPRLEDLVASVFEGVRTYGSEHPIVLRAALRLAERLAEVGQDERARLAEQSVQELRRALAA
ncbi:DUF2254 domain-containing protein [Curtobacterium sp. MCBA15_001]|uniref:DUF2254 domain-containing protein n=1 Tax=Curtobacterium sp. MCBA15_001 TaxID=1898731 RepID=UPI0011142C75|nr:DUF2254 domain-containing protein [Curtobacterium sp. MCBA15_001]